MNRTKDLILKNGAENVNMVDIAEEVELSKATLYLYFHSKEELFREICNTAGRQFMEVFRGRLTDGQQGIDVLKQFWNSYLDLFGETEDILIIFDLKHYLNPDYPVLFPEEQDDPLIVSDFYMILKGALTRGVQEGFFDPQINIEIVSKAILSLFSGIIESAAKLPQEERNPRLMLEELRKLFQIILKGIACQGLEPALLELPLSLGRKT